MKRAFIILLFVRCATNIVWADTAPRYVNLNAPTDAEIVAALSNQSHVPEAELKTYLSDCDANQLSMNFCAYRDAVAANLTLKKAISKKKLQLPACKSNLDKEIARWEKTLNRDCQVSAKKQYGDGSLKNTVQSMCITADTVKMTKKINRMKNCNQKL